MNLLLVRHSETNYNIAGLCNADPSVDVHLSDEGILQTENLSQVLSQIEFDTIFISELPRTKQTADIINQYHDKPIVVDRRLNDNRTGFESRPVGEWLASLEQSGDKWNSKYNDGESLAEAASRAGEFIEYLKTLEFEKVLIVTHGFMTQAIFAKIENKSLDEASGFTLVQGTYAEFEI